MPDTMKGQPFKVLLNWILRELQLKQSIFGIHRSLFYLPQKDEIYATKDIFGHYLATPIGPAAGPHTQLAQNIICSWLSGGRFIELKTVQTMDKLEIPRPCIDMEDEGYNVEWSQELTLEQSADEYIKAWVLIHILRRVLGFETKAPFGTIFNMSVGYDLEGIKSPGMTHFMDQMADGSEEINRIRSSLEHEFPEFADIDIPSQLTNNVTLSTMHGCPPGEIEQIARYLLGERRLHTVVKMNPTLLGKQAVMHILHDALGFDDINIPDAVFDNDLQYGRAIELITALRKTAAKQNLTFGIKLGNTLPVQNHKGILSGKEMYMSGRALYPITINLFYKIVQELDDKLSISYAGGADTFNIAAILACGARPVTVASDLLKPGGYSRLLQYLEVLRSKMNKQGSMSLAELAVNSLVNLEDAASEALEAPSYKKSYHVFGSPKVSSGLGLFDCITAPCIEQCAVSQDVPGYVGLIAEGEYDQALRVIVADNPLPGVTGYICTHPCQSRCTRNDYDEPVAIRALKRSAVEYGSVGISPSRKTDRNVAIIGSGPSGLSAASFLALNGIQVTIFEAKKIAGGMLSIAPAFRLPEAIVQQDINRIISMGVSIELSHPIGGPPSDLLSQGFDAVYIATGFQKDSQLSIAGMNGNGVFTALDFLEQIAQGKKPYLGSRVLVIGGGNTAIDAARTARRITDRSVTVVYRRTKAEMPATQEEIRELLAEGNTLQELASPTKIALRNDRVCGLQCVRNRLGSPDTSGRKAPIPIKRSEYLIEADSVIIAVGQRPDILFLKDSAISLGKNNTIMVDAETGLTSLNNVYAGGDAIRGPSTIIQACADGRRAARAILSKLGIEPEQYRNTVNHPRNAQPTELLEDEIIHLKSIRSRKELQHRPETIPIDRRNGFELVEHPLSERVAHREAARCLQCSSLCDKCVEVCPNRANYVYLVSPVSLMLPQLSCNNNGLRVAGEEIVDIEQSRQIVHVDDLCNQCGNCATFCVHHGKPYLEKPRLFLQREDFEQESDNAFYIKGHSIFRRERGKEMKLSSKDGLLVFENTNVCINLSPDFVVRDMTLKKAFKGMFSLKELVEMALILRGITASLPFLFMR